MSHLNVGNLDRVLRILVGLTLIGFAVSGAIGVWGYFGVVPLLTGLSARCPSTRRSASPRRRAEDPPPGRPRPVLRRAAALPVRPGGKPHLMSMCAFAHPAIRLPGVDRLDEAIDDACTESGRAEPPSAPSQARRFDADQAGSCAGTHTDRTAFIEGQPCINASWSRSTAARLLTEGSMRRSPSPD